MREKLVCDLRGGCVAIYLESRKDDTNGCHKDDARNIAFSDKGAKFNGSYWEMDEATQNLFTDMVNAYNNEFKLTASNEAAT